MASEVGICNEALTALGENTILALTDNSKPARLCNLKYANKRDYLLRRYTWNFATKRVNLSSDVEVPLFEYSAQFTLPSNCLQFRKTYPDSISYVIEGRKILCNETSLAIKYTYRVIDPNQMDSIFLETLAALMARELSTPLSDSLRMYSKMDEAFEVKLSEARFAGSIEEDLQSLKTEEWIDERQ